MNAVKQARNPDLACKIAQIALMFQQEFPDAKVDLAPWLPDADTQKSVDPDSIDLSFNFPGRKPDCQSRSILVQVRFSDRLLVRTAQIIGMEISGYDHQGQQWRLSTVGAWKCEGNNIPIPHAQERLKRFCQTIFKLFQKSLSPTSPSHRLTAEESDLDPDLDSER